MPLVCELPSSVCLPGIIFTHHGLNVLSLPTQPQPAHEGKMATLTIPNLIMIPLNGIKGHC